MDHNVENVQKLYNDATDLYNNVVVKSECSAENMLSDLNAAVSNLKENWKGIDAGGKIQEVITIYNALVKVRNDLARLACDSSALAARYREIQLANGAPLQGLEPLTATDSTRLDDYSDTADTIDINPAAETGRNCIDNVVAVIDNFIQSVQTKYNEIMSNWKVGTGRDQARESFEEFLKNAEVYKKTLNEVSQSISSALKNYSF